MSALSLAVLRSGRGGVAKLDEAGLAFVEVLAAEAAAAIQHLHTLLPELPAPITASNEYRHRSEPRHGPRGSSVA